MKCIVISGKAGHGKDATAQFMKEALESHGKKVITIHYGDAVKWVLREYFNWDGNKDENGRHMLQYIGTDVLRKNYPNFWTGIVAGLLSAFDNEGLFDVALVPDARFENEVEITMETLPDSTCVRVRRENPDGTLWINEKLTEEQRQHPSETSLDNYIFDYIIHNDEGIDLLKESAITVLVDLGII
jgi:hypothetical protein